MALDQMNLIFEEMSKSCFGQPARLNDQGTGRLNFKEEWLPPLNFCFIDERNALLLFAEAGQIPDERELDLLREVLHRQFMFDKSGETEFSLAPDNNALTVQRLLPLEVLDAAKLGEAIAEFVKQLAWVRLKILDRGELAQQSDGVFAGVNFA